MSLRTLTIKTYNAISLSFVLHVCKMWSRSFYEEHTLQVSESKTFENRSECQTMRNFMTYTGHLALLGQWNVAGCDRLTCISKEREREVTYTCTEFHGKRKLKEF